MKLFLLLILITASCQSKNQPPKPSLTGKWVYEIIEFSGGEKIDLRDSLYMPLHKQHEGLTLTFSGEKTFTVTQKKAGKAEEFVASQDYRMEGDTILRLINTGRPDDRFPVVSLTDSVLRVNLFNSPMGYPVFRRKE